MSKQITDKEKGDFKEKTLQEITLQLTQALTDLKESLGEKKFEKRIKKAAKLLAEGIKEKDAGKAHSNKVPATKNKAKKGKSAVPVKKTAKAATSK